MYYQQQTQMGMSIAGTQTDCGERRDQILDRTWVVKAWTQIETGSFTGEVELIRHSLVKYFKLNIGYYGYD